MSRLYNPEPATIVFIEPGDATKYTVILAPRHGYPPNMYVAIGSGEIVRGGYFVPFPDEVEKGLIAACEQSTQRAADAFCEYHSVEYFADRSEIKNRWTAAVGVLCAWLYWRRGEDWLNHVKVIGALYQNHTKLVIGTNIIPNPQEKP